MHWHYNSTIRRGGAHVMSAERTITNDLPDVLAEFAGEYPQVWAAYNRLGNAAAEAGPLDEKTQRLVKLAVAIGGRRQGAVNSHTRRALAAGCTREEIVHVGILAITTMGWPAAFAAICWIKETL